MIASPMKLFDSSAVVPDDTFHLSEITLDDRADSLWVLKIRPKRWNQQDR